MLLGHPFVNRTNPSIRRLLTVGIANEFIFTMRPSIHQNVFLCIFCSSLFFTILKRKYHWDIRTPSAWTLLEHCIAMRYVWWSLRNFRYLYEFLCGWLISAYNRAEAFLIEYQCISETLKSKTKLAGGAKKGGAGGGGGSGGGVSGGPSFSKKKNKDRNHQRPYAREIAYCQALQSLCGGYYKVLLFVSIIF